MSKNECFTVINCIENLGEIECIWGFTVIIYGSLVKISSEQEVLDHVN
jgi:hypothetical protein